MCCWGFVGVMVEVRRNAKNTKLPNRELRTSFSCCMQGVRSLAVGLVGDDVRLFGSQTAMAVSEQCWEP